ncbi:MAG: type II and III secretion system protein [Bacteroidales bacterium]|nr:type II and III secretion system protein [Bacteroidales bacterium]
MSKELATITGYNMVPAPGLDKLKVSCYIQKMTIDGALEKFAFANNLKIRKTDDQVYLVERNEPAPAANSTRQGGGGSRKKTPSADGLEIKKIGGDSISIIANKVSLDEIITTVAEELNIDYYFSSPVQGDATFNIKSINFPTLLNFLFRNTSYSYQNLNGIYLVGDNKGREMKEFRMLQLQNRPIEKVIDVIPGELTRDLELKEFQELNGILAGGLPARIQQLETFLKSIDQIVPVILIEVLIIDIKKSHTVSTGIEAGLGEKPVTTQGKVFPEIDMNLGAQSINNLINSFNGFGTVKIGKVTPNFYLNLKAMENDGFINIRSTPKLSTLNGHEASLSIGNTEYYLEEQSNIYGSLSAQQTITRNYKSVTAELSVKIKPVVSGDDQITLEVEVNQGDFTERISKYAPPGEVSRKFKSLIRVKNQEMVLLGGLEEKRKRESGSGVPLLARIPVIKWLFSSNTSEKTNSKLNIFINQPLSIKNWQMLERYLNSRFVKNSSVYGMYCHIGNDGENTFALVYVENKKGLLSFECIYTPFNHLDEIKVAIKKDVPIYLIVDGKGVLLKKIIPDPDKAIIKQIIPSAQDHEFISDHISTRDKSIIAALARTDLLTDIVIQCKEAGLNVIHVSLGPIKACKVPGYYKELRQTINFGNYSITYDSENDAVNDIIKTDQNQPFEILKIDYQQVKSFYMPALGAGMEFFIEENHDCDFNLVNTNRKEFLSSILVKKLGIGMGILVFLILMINTLFYFHYTDQLNQLEGKISGDKNILVVLDSLKKEVKWKEKFMKETGILKNSRFSFYADRIAKTVPISISLEKLDINPIIGKVRSNKEVLVEPNKVRIEGYTKSSVSLNDWVKSMENWNG